MIVLLNTLNYGEKTVHLYSFTAVIIILNVLYVIIVIIIIGGQTIWLFSITDTLKRRVTDCTHVKYMINMKNFFYITCVIIAAMKFRCILHIY